ncbi:hypothetical protein [Robiginitomaculum antarcticum]|uniref:hypothetical protein n=1 Tax=Robiginitomaculum antarcticum TaxID=437507 RepID=UPI00037FD047|nr:hypothetical protein [Robiginitomaculum antarcticum]
MIKSRFAILAAGAFMTAALAASASAVETPAECTAQGGDLIEVNDGKVCFVPLIAEEFQNDEDYAELKGVYDCKGGTVRKTSIGDFCMIYVERTPKPDAVETLASEMDADGEAVDDAIRNEASEEAGDQG